MTPLQDIDIFTKCLIKFFLNNFITITSNIKLICTCQSTCRARFREFENWEQCCRECCPGGEIDVGMLNARNIYCKQFCKSWFIFTFSYELLYLKTLFFIVALNAFFPATSCSNTKHNIKFLPPLSSNSHLFSSLPA